MYLYVMSHANVDLCLVAELLVSNFLNDLEYFSKQIIN